MRFLFIVNLIFSQETGYLTVNSDRSNLDVYLEGSFIGKTPIINYPVKTGTYSISLFDSETIENEYWKLRNADIATRLSALWQLSRIDAATRRISIAPNQTTKVFFYTSRINRAPTLTKFLFGGCIGGIFGLGVLTGVLLSGK